MFPWPMIGTSDRDPHATDELPVLADGQLVVPARSLALRHEDTVDEGTRLVGSVGAERQMPDHLGAPAHRCTASASAASSSRSARRAVLMVTGKAAAFSGRRAIQEHIDS